MSLLALSVSALLAADPVVHGATQLDGLDLLVVQLPTTSCSARLVVRAGAADDPPGKSGLAHAVEHLALGGPPGRSAFLSSRSHINAITFAGGTIFTLDTSAENCADQLKLLLGVVTDGKLRSSWFAPEMEVIRREAFYGGDHRAILDTSLFGNSAAVVIGTQTTRELLKPIDVVRFFSTHYVPDNMALVVVGTLTPAAVEQVLATSFRLPPSLPEEHPARAIVPVGTRGEARVVGLRSGVIALATALPLDAVPMCRSMAALLTWRLLKRVPGTTDVNAQCLTMQGNLMLSVLLATEPDDEERVRTIAIDEWRKLAAPSATEKALVVHRFLNENRRLEGDPSELADRLAGSATWTRGEALFSLAPAWWAPPEFSDAAVRTVRAATTSERSSVFSGAD